MGKFTTYQKKIQEVVGKGINAAEEQQKKLSAKPFDFVEKLESGVREYSVKSLRDQYDGYSETLFEQIRSTNLRMASFAADMVSKFEKEAVQDADAVFDADAADGVASAAPSIKDQVSTEKKPAATKAPAKKIPAKKTTAAASV